VSNIEKVDSVTLLRKDKLLTGVSWTIRSVLRSFSCIFITVDSDPQCLMRFRTQVWESHFHFLKFLSFLLRKAKKSSVKLGIRVNFFISFILDTKSETLF
jgi:hypothetical protein